MTEAAYRYEFTSKSFKQLQKLAPEIQKRIILKLDDYCLHDPLLRAERLLDFRLGQYRFRIGDWRVVFDVEDNVLIIHLVGHRREIYR